MNSIDRIRRELVEVCHRLDYLGYAPGSSGNVSTRLNSQEILVTRSGCALREVTSKDLVRVEPDGSTKSRMPPSSELNVHLLIYKQRPDIKAVVHAHPPTCVGFAVAGQDLGEPSNLEVYITVGRPCLVPFAPPGEAGALLEPVLKKADAFLLAKHGALTVGGSLEEAERRMETLENFAQALLVARMLGGEMPFTNLEIAGIERFIEKAGIPRLLSAKTRTTGRRRSNRKRL